VLTPGEVRTPRVSGGGFSWPALPPVLVVMAACAVRAPTPPPAPDPVSPADPEPYLAPLEYAGPPCTDAGPSVQILSYNDFRCGKGDLCVRTDQRIRNPTDRAVWFFVDTGGFSAYLDRTYLERPGHDSPFVVWIFEGQGYDQALRLSPGTDIVVRDIHYIQWEHHRRPVREAFVDRIDIDSDRSPWQRSPALLPTQGEFDAEGLNGFIDRYERDDPVEIGRRRHVSIHTLCVQTTDVADSIGPDSGPSRFTK
jgi:hypothetical protein